MTCSVLSLRFASIVLCALNLGGAVASAQYLYLDANGDGIHTAADVLSPAGAATIDVWIDTDTNQDGSAALCPSQDGELTINSYELILRATNGTISWGPFTNHQLDFTTSFGQASSGTEFYGGFGGGVYLPPGRYHLATLGLSVASGTPSVAVASSSSLSGGYLTSFGSQCSGTDQDYTLKLGVDWFDTNGLPYGGVPNSAPMLDQPADMEVAAGSVAHQTLTATDIDGQPLTFSMVDGPGYMTVTTTSAGAGTASGEVTLTPHQIDIGTAAGTVGVSDGIASDQKSFSITVLFGCGEGMCFEERTLPTLTSASLFQLKTGDFNGDSRLDLLSAVPGWFFAIYMGQGNGTFLFPSLMNVISLPGRIWDYQVADMNGDGMDDIVATTDPNQLIDQYYTIHVFLSRGDGTFTSVGYQRDPATLDHFGPTLALDDMNRDGRIDLVMPRSGGMVSVFLGNGDGSLAPAVDWHGASFNIATVGIADVNGDGSQDIIGVGSLQFVVLLGRGDGTFEPLPPRTGPPNGSFLGAGRIDSDDAEDIGLRGIGSLPAGLGSPVSMYLGRTDGTLGQASPLHVFAGGYTDLSFVDMTGDGIADAILRTDGSSGFGDYPPVQSRISVLVGDGTGSFGDRTDVLGPATFVGLHGMVTGDWDSDGGTDLAAIFRPTPNIKIFLNRGYRPNLERPVSIYGPTRIGVSEGITATFAFVSDDPDGDPATFTVDRSGLPPGISLEIRPPAFPWQLLLAVTPDFETEGEYLFTVHASANGTSASWPVQLQVARGNRPPVADAGGPYEGVIGAPVVFDGSGSFDPDGDPLTYRWLFGDGTVGLGAIVGHVYTRAGVFSVQLLVTDPARSQPVTAATTATIAEAYSAEAFLEGIQRTIALVGSSHPTTCIHIEATGGAFDPSDVDPTTVRMKYSGGGPVAEISAVTDRAAGVADQNRDGIPELVACFRREDMRQLLSSVTGRDTVEVTLEGRLTSGALFRAGLKLIVVAGGGPLAAALAPNPLNPSATLSFVSARNGPARVSLFDVSGRLVRTPLASENLPPGYHEVTIDGRDASGERLASGVYFYRIESSGTVARGRFTILR